MLQKECFMSPPQQMAGNLIIVPGRALRFPDAITGLQQARPPAFELLDALGFRLRIRLQACSAGTRIASS
jgi:hypothetical protein